MEWYAFLHRPSRLASKITGNLTPCAQAANINLKNEPTADYLKDYLKLEVICMNIRWLGHSCFLFTGSEGLRVLTDPYDESVGYPVPRCPTDIVLVSHHHHDHDSVHVLPGKPHIVDTPGRKLVSGLEIKGVSAFHDEAQGAKRGKNILYTFTMDGIRVIHLGDLGHLLTAEQLASIGRVDVACIPVGGFYTIDAKQAFQVAQQLNPRIVLPMHYKLDDRNSYPIDGIESFLGNFTKVQKAKTLDVSQESLPESLEAIVLEFYV